jgi:adenylosuccinate synthase
MKSSVIIGANWGDEGKGLMTDYLCKKYDADLVIRFNGGAQAGHTVVTPEGERHVFAHIGSGYFLGVPTYLSEYFILNPIIFRRELTKLFKTKKKYHDVYVSPKSQITTYWDMLANRAMEEMRGLNAHGSCGVGINATLYRAEIFSFTIGNFFDSSFGLYSEIQMRVIKEFWENELAQFSQKTSKPIPEWVIECFNQHEAINKHFIDDVLFMKENTTRVDDVHKFFLFRKYGIFEGAQGLALDQFYGNYPYVTRSNTGMRNIVELSRKYSGSFSIDEIVYVSRTYETRHGNDPTFTSSKPLPETIVEKTNIENEWQGKLFFRELSFNGLSFRIRLDLDATNRRTNYSNAIIRLALTHADQISVSETGKKVFDERIGRLVTPYYTTAGETRETVSQNEGLSDEKI